MTGADPAPAARGLPAPRPEWRRDADVVIAGSGAAGIPAALAANAAGLRVLLVTKDLAGGATPLAQGGLAAAIGPGDTTAAHVSDTLTAGAGLCEPAAVAALTAGAPGAISWLTGLGARLETRELRLEGGHSHHRIVHSGDDATGAEVHRALLSALLASGVAILDRTVALDLVTGQPEPGATTAGVVTGLPVTGMPVTDRAVTDRAVTGLAAAVIEPDGRLSPGLISARAVVLAAGGLGQAFATTSNPAGATGDAIAIAARAGAVLRDLEFVQFHPTVLWLPEASGQCPLITEALRGAGAVLRDHDGSALMADHDPRGDLAPRDVVAARMAGVIAAGGTGHVWLDATALGRDVLENWFPTVTAACRKHGIDPVTGYIPVAPGAHYSCGGIRASLDGRTSIAGLYAVGEAASTGVQGANRLASNSVTEAIIAGRRAGEAIAAELAGLPAPAGPPEPAGPLELAEPLDWAGPLEPAGPWGPGAGVGPGAGLGSDAGLGAGTGLGSGAGARAGDRRRELAAAMSRWAGVMRDRAGLAELARMIAAMDGGPFDPCWTGTAAARPETDAGREHAGPVPGDLDLETVEAANLRTVSLLIAVGALRRAESRGCHRRRDAAGVAGEAWHTLLRWDGQRLMVTQEAL